MGKPSKLLAILTLCLTCSFSATAETLQQVVQEVVLTYPEVRKEVALWRSYQFDIREGKAAFLPRIDLTAGIGYEEVRNGTANTLGDGLTRRELSIQLTQNLFNGWQDQENLNRLKARLDAQALRVRAALNQTLLNATQAYLEVLRTQDLVNIAELNVKTHKNILQQIKLRFDSGLSDEVELDQAKARLALAESNLIAQASKLADARARYHRMVGHEAPDTLSMPNFSSGTLPPDLETALSIALLEHPLLRSAYADVAEAKAQQRASRGAFLPQVDAELRRSWNENINGIAGPNEDLQAMLRLRYNLYRGGGDQARSQSTTSLYQQAMEIRNNTRRQVMENLRFAWNAMVMAQNQMTHLDKHIKLTRRTLLGYRKQFALGRRSLLDILNTENEYNAALTEMSNARFDLLAAHYRLLEALGRIDTALGIQFNLAKNDKDYHHE